MTKHPFELPLGRPDAPIWFLPSYRGALLDAEATGTIRVLDSEGGLIVSDTPLVWDEEAHGFTGTLNTRFDAFRENRLYEALIRIETETTLYYQSFLFETSEIPWTPNVTHADLLALAPILSFEGAETPPELGDALDETERTIRSRLHSPGLYAAQIRDKTTLDQALLYGALSLLYLRSSEGSSEPRLQKRREWQRLFERTLSALLSRSSSGLPGSGLGEAPSPDLRRLVP